MNDPDRRDRLTELAEKRRISTASLTLWAVGPGVIDAAIERHEHGTEPHRT